VPDSLSAFDDRAIDTATAAKRYAVAGKLLLSRLRTFLAFPEWFYLNEPANTMRAAVPRMPTRSKNSA
jgi:hypothetical protein